MPGEHAETIFAELRRIGVEPDLASAPLVATGFTRRSLVEWLQRVPSDAGLDELQRRFDEHAREALAAAERAGQSLAADESRVDQSPSYGQVRWWPTTLMLDAGIRLLAEEWDPFGVRLVGVPAEDIGEYAFHLFGPLLHTWRGEEPLAQVAAVIAAIEGQLGLRASPVIHRRYLAARLREIVARHPLPVREPRPQGQAMSVYIAPANDRPSPLDPEGVCDRCHKFGTVARVTTESDPPRSLRFCGPCWRVVRLKYVNDTPANPELEPWGPDTEEAPVSVDSRSWDDTADFVRLVLTARNDPERGSEITPELLAQLASEIVAEAHRMDGPMPEEVHAFVRTYAPSA